MIGLLLLLLAAAGFVLIPIGFVLYSSNPLSLGVSVLGVLVIGAAYTLDKRRANRAEAVRHISNQRRIQTLTAMPWTDGQCLSISTSASSLIVALIALLSLALGLSMLYPLLSLSEAPWWLSALGLVITGASSVLALRNIVRCFGKPTLRLTVKGVESPIYGAFAWAGVHGVRLQKFEFRGSKQTILLFKLNEDASRNRYTSGFDRLLQRLLNRGRVAQMNLNGSSEEPEVVEAVARFLWQQSTGRSHDWNPLMSDEYNAATRRMQGFMHDHKNSSDLKQSLVENPNQLKEEFESFQRDQNVIATEAGRLARKTRRTLLFGMAIVLAISAYRFYSR